MDPFRFLTDKINPQVRLYAVALYGVTRKYSDTSGQWCGRGWDTAGSSTEHNSGLAFDWITSKKVGVRPTNAEFVAAMKIVNFFVAHGADMGLAWIIFSIDGKNKWLYNVTEKKWKNKGSSGNISFRHIDHIHFKFKSNVKFNKNIKWTLEPGKVSKVTEEEMNQLVLKLLNFKVTANGKHQELVSHMVSNFVFDQAQSIKLAELSTRMSELANQVSVLNKLIAGMQ